jgi:hypothetical protein
MTKLTQEQIQSNKIEFINLLRSTGREGIETLINWLETKSDFFIAPSSTIYHGNYDGGLCQHSLNVYKAAKEFIKNSQTTALKEYELNKTYADDKVAFSEYLTLLREEIRKDTMKKIGQQVDD